MTGQQRPQPSTCELEEIRREPRRQVIVGEDTSRAWYEGALEQSLDIDAYAEQLKKQLRINIATHPDPSDHDCLQSWNHNAQAAWDEPVFDWSKILSRPSHYEAAPPASARLKFGFF